MSAAEAAAMESEIAATAGSPVKKVAEAQGAKEPAENGDGPAESNGTSSPSKDRESEIASANTHLAAGKRALVIGDANGAVETLAAACEKFGKLYGETANECGEAYFYYGKALLEMARMEAGVIDNVLDGVPDTEDEEDPSFVEGPKPTDEEKEKIADDVDKALEENYEELEKAKETADKNKENGETKPKEEVDGASVSKTNGNGTSETEEPKKESEENSAEDEDEEEDEAEGEAEGDEEKKEGAENSAEGSPSAENGEAEKADNESIGSNEAGPSASKESTDKVAQAQEEEEDPSNLQLAWEMLELAKSIFTKHADSLEAKDEKRLALEDKLSETYQTLGEVSIENENYPQAVEDLGMCLRRRQELLPEDSRCIAETHYQLGVALGFNTQFDEAVNALNDAISVLEKRVANLKTSKESPDKKDEIEKIDKEIVEIEGLIPEIREKIADTKDMQQESVKRIGDRRLMEEAIAAKATAGEQNGAAKETNEISPKKSAGNISHLVKKRKKSEGGEEEADKVENGEVKKPHLETTNGTATAANGTNGTNGH